MNRTIALKEVTEIVNAVSDFVFVETDGVVEYYPEYLEVTKAYYKILFYVPEMILEGETIFDFYTRYMNGELAEALNNYINPVQSQYIDKAIDDKIKFKKDKLINPISNSLVRLFDNISKIVENQSQVFDGVDMKNVIEGISNINKNLTAEEIADIFVNKKYPKNETINPMPKKTRTRKVNKTNEVK